MRGIEGALRLALVITIGIGRLLGAVFRGIKGILAPGNTDGGPVVARQYSDVASFQAEARVLSRQGYSITSIAGLPGHVDLVRAAIDGSLSDLANVALGTRSTDKIVVVYDRQPH